MPIDGAHLTQTVVSIAAGLGLAAACGFRVFVPLLIAGVASRTGHLPLADGFAWLGSWPALLGLGVATVSEIGAYYIPWLDHALDTVATPAAVLAGMFASASVLTDLPPLLKWTVTLIGGGGLAGLIQGTSVLLRIKSAALTGGLANPVISTGELIGATVTALLAVVIPVFCLAAVVVLIVLAFRASGRLMFGRSTTPPVTPAT